MRRTPEISGRSRTGLFLVGVLGLSVSTAFAQTETATTATETETETEVEAPPPPAVETPPPPAIEPPPPAVTTTPEAPPPAATTEEKKQAEELVVTGSRIRRLDLVTPAPVAVLGRQEIQESGLASVGQILQNLPSQSNGINIQTNNGGDGSTRINLRGLGTERTLVLVNGRRFVPGGTGANASVDLNAIPVSIIERIEVLKDGASAVYGSDAIGGVVNIITKKNFSGVEGSTYIGSGQVGGLVYDLSVTAGHTTDRGNILLAFSLYDNKEIFAGEREFSNPDTAFDYLADADMDGMPDCRPTCDSRTEGRIATLGSSAVPQTYISVPNDDTAGNEVWQELQQREMNPNARSTQYFNDPVDGWRRFRNTGVYPDEGDQYNYQPDNYLLTPSQRYSLFAIGSYDIFEDLVTVYGEASYTNRQSDQLLAPEAFFGDAEGIVVSADNPYNPFGRDFATVRRRFSEAGGRQFLQDLDTYRAVVGLNGGLPDGLGILSDWRWDASFTFGRTEGTEVKRGLLVRENVARAVGPGFIDADGIYRCGTPDAPIEGCVPLDLFGGAGSITQEMLDYLTYTGTARGFTQQQVVDIGINGPLFSLFDRDIALAIGYQHRDEEGGFQPDPLTEAGNTTGNKGEATFGGYALNAVYGELGLPLHFGIPAVETIELNGALRWVTISSDRTAINPDPRTNSALTWKAGARWQLFDHVALRGSASRSFRAPSIGELFSGQADSFPAVTDPCSVLDANTGQPRQLTPAQQANCAAQGVPADLEDDRSQLLERVGGNTQLEPETADVFTGGIVITPKFGPWTEGLSLTVDYWNISIDNAIDAYGADIILANCYNVDPSVSTGCDLISRRPDGLIDTITDLETNISGGIQTAGIDFGLVYRLPTDFGTFRYSFDGTWLQKYDAKFSDSILIKGKGVYDLGVQSNFKFNNTLSYSIAGFSIGFNVRFINGFRECEFNNCSEDQNFDGQPDDANGDGVVNEDDLPRARKVPSYVTADIFAGYRIAWDIGLTDIGVGINNIADATPPFIDNGFTANSDETTYDYIGRYFYARLTHTF